MFSKQLLFSKTCIILEPNFTFDVSWFKNFYAGCTQLDGFTVDLEKRIA